MGTTVELNQTLCTLETAKAEVEIPSPYAGRVSEPGGRSAMFSGRSGARAFRHGADGDGGVRSAGTGQYQWDATQSRSRGLRHRRHRRLEPPPGTLRTPCQAAVRKLAAELLVDLADVPPGPDGIVTREAVLARPVSMVGSGPASAMTSCRSAVSTPRWPSWMTLSRNQIPDAHAVVDVDGTRLVELRDALGVTPFALTMRLLVLALANHRILNSTWVDGPDGPQVAHPARDPPRCRGGRSARSAGSGAPRYAGDDHATAGR